MSSHQSIDDMIAALCSLLETDKLMLSNFRNNTVRNFVDGLEIEGFETLPEKIWALVNHVTERPRCQCGHLTKFNRTSSGYFAFCSKACAAKFSSKKGSEHHLASQATKDKIAKTNLERYGVKSPLQLKQVHTAGVEAAKRADYDRGANLLSDEFAADRKEKIEKGEYHTQQKDVKEKIRTANKRKYDASVLPPKLDKLKSLDYELQSEFVRFADSTWVHECGTVFEAIPNSRFDVFCPNCKKQEFQHRINC
jgi:hypothetical protein